MGLALAVRCQRMGMGADVEPSLSLWGSGHLAFIIAYFTTPKSQQVAWPVAGRLSSTCFPLWIKRQPFLALSSWLITKQLFSPSFSDHSSPQLSPPLTP